MKVKEGIPSDGSIKHLHTRTQKAGLAPLTLSFMWEKAEGFPYVGS